MTAPLSDKPLLHILALSGGKDSSALAVFMKDKAPEMGYVFCAPFPIRDSLRHESNGTGSSRQRPRSSRCSPYALHGGDQAPPHEGRGMRLGLFARFHFGYGAAPRMRLQSYLLGELKPVAKNRHEAVNDMLEGVHVIVEQHDLRVPAENRPRTLIGPDFR